MSVLFTLIGALILVAVAGVLWMTRMPGRSFTGEAPPLSASELALRDRLAGHLEVLAVQIGERNMDTPGSLARAERYLTGEWEAMGLPVSREEFQVKGMTVSNLITRVHGTERPEEVVLVGGHYDSVPACPGANDNGSGAASVLELARQIQANPPKRTVRFVAFVNEENPYFATEGMGSWVHAAGSRERGDAIVAMISVETIGYYTDADGSQKYPFPLAAVYPGTGNFIAFVSNLGNRDLVRRCVESFRGHTFFPSEGGALPGGLPGVGWSDHWAYWQEGYPSVMITDTAPFRYPQYHTPDDTPDRMDLDRTARVVEGIGRVVLDLANAP